MTRMKLSFKEDDFNSKPRSSGLKGFASNICQRLQYLASLLVCLTPMPKTVIRISLGVGQVEPHEINWCHDPDGIKV